MFICLRIVYRCFFMIAAELSSCNRDFSMTMKPKIFTVWLFTGKFAKPWFTHCWVDCNKFKSSKMGMPIRAFVKPVFFNWKHCSGLFLWDLSCQSMKTFLMSVIGKVRFVYTTVSFGVSYPYITSCVEVDELVSYLLGRNMYYSHRCYPHVSWTRAFLSFSPSNIRKDNLT